MDVPLNSPPDEPLEPYQPWESFDLAQEFAGAIRSFVEDFQNALKKIARLLDLTGQGSILRMHDS